MRISTEQANYIRDAIQKKLNGADVYLFGSRADDSKSGGDIDILVINDEKLGLSDESEVKTGFFEKFGEQKLDIITCPSNNDAEQSEFCKLIKQEAIKL